MKKLLNTLYVITPNRYLSLNGENVVISENKKEIARVPMHNLERIMLFGGTGASPALMEKCVLNACELVFMSRNGKFQCRAEGEINGNVLLRRTQYRIADNPEQSLQIAQSIISAKIHNSRRVLERTVCNHPTQIDMVLFQEKIKLLQDLIQIISNAKTADILRGIEGEAASAYFSVFNEMVLQQKDIFQFTGRNRRPPLDRINAMLSFAYTLCTGMCIAGLEAVGLDSYVGFLHTDRPGRRSLALDLVEEFRAQMCDRFVLTMINNRMISLEHFEQHEDGEVMLNNCGRSVFLTEWQKRKADEIMHPFLNEKVQWGMLPYVQALLLARYMRGDLKCYPAFEWR